MEPAVARAAAGLVLQPRRPDEDDAYEEILDLDGKKRYMEGNLLEVEEEEKDEEEEEDWSEVSEVSDEEKELRGHEEEEDHAGRNAAGSSANYIPIRYRPRPEKTRARRSLLGRRQERERQALCWKHEFEMAKADRAVGNADLGVAAQASFEAYEDALADAEEDEDADANAGLLITPVNG